MSLSTNQLSSWSSMALPAPCARATVKVAITRPAVAALVTLGSRISAGRSARTRETASRTSFTASDKSFSRMNSTVTVATPSSTRV